MTRKAGVLLLGSLLFLAGRAAFAAAQCAAGETPQTCFDRAFALLCGIPGPRPGLCAGGKQDHRWLLLSEHCARHAGEPPCELFVSANALDPELAPTVLAYDHPSGIWNARHALDGDLIEKDAGGKPTVSLHPDEELIVVVENTNPLLYTLTAGAVTETTIPELTELQKLAGLLGGNLQAFLRVAADDAQSLSGSSLEDFIESFRDKAQGLQAATAQVKCLVEQTTARSGQIADFVQAVELQQDATFSLSPPVCGTGAAQVAVSASSMSAGFEALSLAYREAADLALTCTPLLEPVVRLAGGEVGKPADLQKAILDFDALDRQLPCRLGGGDVQQDLAETLRLLVADLRQPVADTVNATRNVAQLEAEVKRLTSEQPGSPELSAKQQELSTAQQNLRASQQALEVVLSEANTLSLPALRAASALTERLKGVLDAAAALLKERDNARRAASQLELFQKRLDQFLLGGTTACNPQPCLQTSDVRRTLVLNNDPRPVRWDKIQSHSIKLAAGAPLASAVLPALPGPVEAPYSLDSALRSLWGIGASVIYTSLKSPVFSAVTDPTNDSQKIIAETDQETRAGDLALLVDYNVGQRLCATCTVVRALGVEFGAGLDTARPAFFAGISARLGKYVRIGSGVTYQRIKELDGQDLGDVVKETADIKQRDKFEPKVYFSLSVVLNSALRLFTAN